MESITKEPTEEAEGSKEKSCSVCEYTVTEEIAKLEHTHKFASEWKIDETNHWHASTCGHEVTEGKTSHTFGDWITTKAATEEAEGSKERTCTVCGYKATEVIEKLAHTHKVATDWTKDETNHWHAVTCGCSDVELQKKEHTFGEWITTKEATCTEDGSKTGVCEVCKKEVTEKIDAKGHSNSGSWKNDDKNHWKECTGCKEQLESAEHEYEWTKDASGHWYECVCGAKKDFEEHTYDIWKVVQDPTDTQAGRNERTCKDCAYIDSVVLQPAPEGFRFVQGGIVTGALPTWLNESASDYYKGVFIEGRSVTLSDFYMGKYEVTQKEYASVMAGQKVTVNGTEFTLASDPSYCKEDSTSRILFNGDEQEKRPVENVTWYDAVWYCNALSKKESLTPAYNIEVTSVNSNGNISGATVTLVENANGYRLPTEAEWEFAARGGDPTAANWNYVFSGADTAEGVYYNSSKNAGLDSVGWYRYNNITGITGDSAVTNNVSGCGTHQVGKKALNRLGLYDMSGNVSEWCYDCNGTITTTTPADGTSGGSGRVSRGGSWFDVSGLCAVSFRGSNNTNYRYYNLGFRVVRLSN